uniref:Uncharacterized protein n=1 Tax=Rhizophora mucronata TaxID=61149 RepID=A0A2P2Q201_RHIMU
MYNSRDSGYWYVLSAHYTCLNGPTFGLGYQGRQKILQIHIKCGT